MEWLKKLLEAAQIKDGKLDVDALMTSINAEFPKNAVPKDTYNTLAEVKKQLEKDVYTRDKQIEDLKKVDAAGLQSTIEKLQKENKEAKDKYEADMKELTLTNAIKMAIADKAQDTDLVAGLVDKAKLVLGDDGKITGLDEQIKGLKESKAFLFKEEKQEGPTFKGFKPVEGKEKGNENDSSTSAFFAKAANESGKAPAAANNPWG